MGKRQRGVGAVPSVLAAFLAGVIVAVVVVPNRHSRSAGSNNVSSAGAFQPGAGGAGAESGTQTSGEPGVSGAQAALGPGGGATDQGVGNPLSGATTGGTGSTGGAGSTGGSG